MTEDYPNLFAKTWQETDEQVKNDYGNEYFEKAKSIDKRMRFFQRKNIKEVVEAITKGVITKSPEYQYQCAGEITKFSLMFFNLVPLRLTDFIWKIITLN